MEALRCARKRRRRRRHHRRAPLAPPARHARGSAPPLQPAMALSGRSWRRLWCALPPARLYLLPAVAETASNVEFAADDARSVVACGRRYRHLAAVHAQQRLPGLLRSAPASKLPVAALGDTEQSPRIVLIIISPRAAAASKQHLPRRLLQSFSAPPPPRREGIARGVCAGNAQVPAPDDVRGGLCCIVWLLFTVVAVKCVCARRLAEEC